MLIFQAIVLGVVQGLAEFIPISSSAHLIIVPWLFGWDNPVLDSLSFDVALHLGTLVALLWFFAADWVRLIRAGVASIVKRKVGDDIDRRLAWLIVIGTIPGGIAGVLGEKAITELFHKPNAPIAPMAMIVMAIIIALLGGILFVAERVRGRIANIPQVSTSRLEKGFVAIGVNALNQTIVYIRQEILIVIHPERFEYRARNMNQLSLKDTILIGLAQAFAIFPGVSRSGSTITAGLFLGLEREAAARFSFLLSAPIIAGAGAKSLVDIYSAIKSGAIAQNEFVLFPVGFIAAAISGYFCIRFLLRYLQKNSTDLFVYYRWALALLILAVAVLRG